MKISVKGKLTALALLMTCSSVDAANWLMLQGTQPEVVAPKGVKVPYRNKKPKVWGFIQANYKKDFGKVLIKTGTNKTPFSLLNPDLKSQSGFNIFRARVALRGMADNDNQINYFIMTDFANNGVNNLGGHRGVATYFTDASITAKNIPYAKIRVGKFKYPGSEEGLQAVFVSPYIDFTTMSNQQMLERFVTNVGAAQTGAAAGGASTTHYTSTSIDEPIGAFRDVGIQIFDTIDIANKWTASYAYMYGNGSGISFKGSDKQATNYVYLAFEKNLDGGKGFYTKSMKFYAWGQKGDRYLLSNNATPINAKRTRYGLGATYYNHGLRLEGEYMKAKGMIFTGAKDKNAAPLVEDWQFQYAVGEENEADGGYLNVQYELFPKKFEVFTKYDWQNRLTNDVKGERDFTTITLGASYRFRGPTRVDFNYLIRDAKAPGNANAQKVLDNYGDRAEVQFTMSF